ncbi:MAG TPA: hypothetical protein VNB24_07505 [Acidimicrobiales bacterium]|nr:hypothetical protein [Acidimicrobiales bacterium]
MPTSPQPESTVPAGAFGATVERIDVDHILHVVRKWSLLIIGGVLAAVLLALVISRANLPPYEAKSTLFLDQPIPASGGSEGRAVTVKIFSLGRTYAELAKSDQVMVEVQRRLRTNVGLNTLRSRIRVEPVADTQLLNVVGIDRSRTVAERLATSVNEAFRQEVERYQLAADVPPVQRLLITTIRSPDAVRPPTNEGRTIALTAVLALIIMIGVAFLLEYIQTDPEATAEPQTG